MRYDKGNFLGLEKAPEIPFSDLAQLNGRSKKVFLLAASQLDGNKLSTFLELFKECQGHLVLDVFFSGESRLERYNIESKQQLFCLIKSPDFFGDFFYEIVGGKVCGYHSARDDFCVFAVEEGYLSQQTIAEFDIGFAKHLRESGVGFGLAGNTYITEIIRQLPISRASLLRVRPRKK